jgi:hypothetical protein
MSQKLSKWPYNFQKAGHKNKLCLHLSNDAPYRKCRSWQQQYCTGKNTYVVAGSQFCGPHWDVYSGSRIRIFPSRIRIKEFKYFKPKKGFLSSWKYDSDFSSRIRILTVCPKIHGYNALDPGSGSATLLVTRVPYLFNLVPEMFL